MKNFSKNIVLGIVIGLLLIGLFNLFQNSSSTNINSEISFSDFLIAADNGNISEVKIVGNNVTGFF
jgi:cell division protease FtsH